MIQFNLLPDVKKDYIKAKRTKRLIFSGSIIAAAVAVGVVLFLFSIVQIAQKQNIEDLTKDIDSGVASVQSIQDLNKILTIQQQLQSLPGLHQLKPESSRLFGYLTQVTPADVKISSMNMDFEASTMSLEGSAPSIASVNRFTDTIKFAKFKYEITSEESEPTMSEETFAFSNVATELSRNEETASYKITFTFDATLFDNTKEVSLIVPNTVTTRSTQGKPDISDNDENPLFAPNENEEENN